MMSNAKPSRCPWSLISAALIALAAFSMPMHGQEADKAPAQDAAGAPAKSGSYIDDWSFHRLIYSSPGTQEDAVKSGKLDKWTAIVNSPRYQMQQAVRSKSNVMRLQVTPDSSLITNHGGLGGFGGFGGRPGIPSGLHHVFTPNFIDKDWQQPLGGVTTSLVSNLAATNSASTVSASSTITVGTQTFTGSAPTTAESYGVFSGIPTSGQTITITNNNPANTLVLHSIPGNGEGTDTFGVEPTDDDTITIGATTYTWVTSSFDCEGQGNPPCIYRGGTAAEAAQNLASALTNGTVACADKPGFGTIACEFNVSAANADVTVSYTVGNAFVTLTNTQAATITFSTTDTGEETLDPPTGTGIPVNSSSASNNCSSETLGYYSIGTSAATAATNLGTAISNCNTTYPNVGVSLATGAPSGDTYIQADIPGTTANAIGLTETTTNFAWHTTTLGGTGALTVATNGAGDTSTLFNYWSGSTYDTGSQLATDIHDALVANTTVTTTDGITGTAGTNDITFATTKAGPFGISVANFPAFTNAGTISDAATPGTVQPSMYPAKYGQSLTSASCANDFVVYPTGQVGSAGMATIIAFNNLYSSCSGTVPSVAWAINTEGALTGYAATTSPVLSLDGSKVAFIQSNGTNSYLIVVDVASAGGTLTSPTTIATGSSNITTCSAPCMTQTELSHNDTYSSPFYDYNTDGGDELYVGDDSGNLEQFMGVFNGAVNISGSPWPVNLGTAKITSPTLEPTSGYIAVGDMAGTLHFVTASTGAIHGTTGTAEPLGDAIIDAPLVDGNTGQAFVFVNQSGNYSETGLNAVYQYPISYSGTTVGSPGVVALATATNGLAGHYLYDGTFDNVYFESTNGTGNLYSVGNTGLTTGATLFKEVMSSGGLVAGGVTSAVTGLTVSGANAYPWPSGVTEFCNGACTVQTATGCTFTTASTTVTCTGGGFTAANVGDIIYGTGIQGGSTIATFTNATTIKLSVVPGTTEASPVTLTIGDTNSGTDYVFFSVNRGNVGTCTNTAGNGCIMSYNVTNPGTTGTLTVAGEQNYANDTGTGGCWPTSGIVIDNDSSTVGASQIYFIALNGAEAGNPSVGTSTACGTAAAAGTTIQGIQASQSAP
jgi:hypothetical protein